MYWVPSLLKYKMCSIQSILVKFTDNDDCAIIPNIQISGICFYDGKLTIFKAKIGVTFQLRNIDKTLRYINTVR